MKGRKTLNQAFKALADPTRRKILDLLKEGDLTAGEIAEHFNMTKPSISHHLNALKMLNLFKMKKRSVRYVLSKHNCISRFINLGVYVYE